MILNDLISTLSGMETLQWAGRVREIVGLLIASDGPAAAVGRFLRNPQRQGRTVRAQVVGFRDGRVLLMPLEETGGLQLGDTVVARPGSGARRSGPATAGARARRLRQTDGRRARD